MKTNETTFEEFYERIKQTYLGNNRVYKVEVKFDDGNDKSLKMVYTTSKGFEQYQTQRKGTIEVLMD